MIPNPLIYVICKIIKIEKLGGQQFLNRSLYFMSIVHSTFVHRITFLEKYVIQDIFTYAPYFWVTVENNLIRDTYFILQFLIHIMIFGTHDPTKYILDGASINFFSGKLLFIFITEVKVENFMEFFSVCLVLHLVVENVNQASQHLFTRRNP